MNILINQKTLNFRAKRQADNDFHWAVVMLLFFLVGMGGLVIMQQEWFMGINEHMIPVGFGLFEVQNTDEVFAWPMFLLTVIAFTIMVFKGIRYIIYQCSKARIGDEIMKVRLDNEEVVELLVFGMPTTPLIIAFSIAVPIAIYTTLFVLLLPIPLVLFWLSGLIDKRGRI